MGDRGGKWRKDEESGGRRMKMEAGGGKWRKEEDGGGRENGVRRRKREWQCQNRGPKVSVRYA